MRKLTLLIAMTMVALLGLAGSALAASTNGTADVEVLQRVGIVDPNGDPIVDLAALDFGKVVQPVAPNTAVVAIAASAGATASGDNLTGSGGGPASFDVDATPGNNVGISSPGAPTCSTGISLTVSLSQTTAVDGDTVYVGGEMTVDSTAPVSDAAATPPIVSSCTFTVSANYN